MDADRQLHPHPSIAGKTRWCGMRMRYGAYQREIDYANSIGDHESVERLNQAIREEYSRIFGVDP